MPHSALVLEQLHSAWIYSDIENLLLFYFLQKDYSKRCKIVFKRKWAIWNGNLQSSKSFVAVSNLLVKSVGWFCWCFMDLWHFSGHFRRSLPVLSAHSFTSNWQLPFLNQQKERMAVEIISWPNSKKELCRTWGSNPRQSAYQADADPTKLPYPAKLVGWLYWWFMAQQHFSGHFRHGQLIYPHCPGHDSYM